MGGKVWSSEEEKNFWETIIPQSPIAPNPEDEKLSWDECAKLMQRTTGGDARREYTGSMLCRFLCIPRLLTLLTGS